MSDSSNPLLDFSGLPRFGDIQPAHVVPAVEKLLAEARAVIARLEADTAQPTWQSFVRPLEATNERLSRAWGVVGHLHAVLDSPALREAYNAAQPAVVQFYTELGQNLALFERYKTLQASSEYGRLSPAQRKILDNEIRDFRLSGAELPPAQKQRLAEIQEEQARLATRFSENVLDATNAFTLQVRDAGRLAGLPEDALQAARQAAEKAGMAGGKFTLQAPSYLAVMQHADDRALREVVYRGYVTRASEEFAAALERKSAFEGATGPAPEGDPNQWDNGPIIERILALRHEQAKLLGFANYAELSLVAKMADTPVQVIGFLEELAEKALPFARRDLEELQSFARDELGLASLESWDIAWASEKLRARRYAFSDQEVKQYFPEDKVLDGLFGVVQKLYGVRFEPDQAPCWDPSVRFFRILDDDAPAKGAAVRGRFYLDTYARETKRGGAWMDEAVARQRTDSGLQVPVAYLVCNFSAPVGGKPALLTHDDVLTLFHEFGHGLHHLLSQVDHLGVSGIRGVEWDAVELPSQFMENFCWEWEVLSQMTAHVDSGEPLPRTLFERMLAARNFQSGMQMLRQIEFSLFDMRLHHDFDPAGQQSVQQLLDQIRQQVAVMIPPDWNRFPNSFGHIFSGGYSAGYYSYKWAEVLSADAYSAFEEARLRGLAEGTGRSVLDPDTGARFRREVLSVGGSRPALQSFQAFRGRAPNADALLRHSGMTVERAEDGAATVAA